MLVKCESISGSDVPEIQRFFGETDDSTYSPLIVGNRYVVFGILFYTGRIDYLLSENRTPPIWAPSCLFSVINSASGGEFHLSPISEASSFQWLYKTYGAKFIIGYRELVESFEHFSGLLERNEQDLVIFYKNQNQILDLP